MLVRRPQILAPQAQIYIGEQAAPHVVVALRRHGEEYLLRLAGIGDRNAAESLRGLTIYLRAEEQEPLPEGVFYIHQIEGLRVVTEDGKELGKVSEILKTGANDVYVVVSDRGEVLLPAIPPVIREVRVEEGTMVVRLLDGLLDGSGDKIGGKTPENA
jgi:16S rRNA processing protein RimM